MTVIIRLFVFLFSVVLLISCSVPTIVLFSNATLHEIIITYRNEKREEKHIIVKPSEQIEINRLLDVDFSISFSNKNYNYKMRPIPESYIDDIGVGPYLKRVVKAKLWNDGCIYLVKIKSDFEAENKFDQPKGFPLCPTMMNIE